MSALDMRPRAGALVVPYVVDADRCPVDFKVMDTRHVNACAEQGRCGICGGKIRRGPIAFIGPADKRDCFADPWMHPTCAELAMRQCPFLADRRGWRDPDAAGDALIGMYAHNMVLYTATGWGAHRDATGRWHFRATNGLMPA